MGLYYLFYHSISRIVFKLQFSLFRAKNKANNPPFILRLLQPTSFNKIRDSWLLPCDLPGYKNTLNSFQKSFAERFSTAVNCLFCERGETDKGLEESYHISVKSAKAIKIPLSSFFVFHLSSQSAVIAFCTLRNISIKIASRLNDIS